MIPRSILPKSGRSCSGGGPELLGPLAGLESTDVAGADDCSRGVIAVHQNHDYAYSPGGSAGTDGDELAMRNKQISGNGEQLRSIRNATHILTRSGRIMRVRHYSKWVSILELSTSSGILGTYVLAAKAIRSTQGDLHEAKEYVEMRAVTPQDGQSSLARVII